MRETAGHNIKRTHRLSKALHRGFHHRHGVAESAGRGFRKMRE